MAVGDIYRVKLRSSFFAQQILNVFYYQVSSGSNIAEDLALAFSDVAGDISGCQASALSYNDITVENLDNLADFNLTPFTSAGAISGEYLSPFVAWGFRYNRATRAVRNGSKRITGVPESLVQNGAATNAALDILEPIAVSMGNDLTGASGAVYRPVIFHKDPEAPAGGVGFVVQDVVYVRLTTQNTRKIGRGV